MKIPKGQLFPLSGKRLAEHISNLLKTQPLTVQHLARRPEFQKGGQAQHEHIAVYRHVIKQYVITDKGGMRFRESNGLWQCSYAHMADQMRLSKEKIRRILHELHQKGLVVIEQKTIYVGGNPIPYVTFLKPDEKAMVILGKKWEGTGPVVDWQGKSLENRKSKMQTQTQETPGGVWANQGTGVQANGPEVWAKTHYPYTVLNLPFLNLRQSDRPTDPQKVQQDLPAEGPPAVPSEEPEGQPQVESARQVLGRTLTEGFLQQLLDEDPARSKWFSLPASQVKRTIHRAREQEGLSRGNFLTLLIRQLDQWNPNTNSVTTKVVTKTAAEQASVSNSGGGATIPYQAPPPVPQEEHQRVQTLANQTLELLKSSKKRAGQTDFHAMAAFLRNTSTVTLPT